MSLYSGMTVVNQVRERTLAPLRAAYCQCSAVISEDKVLAVRHVLEQRVGNRSPLRQVLEAVRPRIGELYYGRVYEAAEPTGWVVEFEGNTGHERYLGCKILNCVKEQGFDVICVVRCPATEHRWSTSSSLFGGN